MHDKVTSVIHTKNIKDKSYKEFSIYQGLYELLVAGGYVLFIDTNEIVPFLGSSLFSFGFESETADQLFLNMQEPECINTYRFLQQCMKNHIDKPWGFHSLSPFSRDFTSIITIGFGNHCLLKYKAKTLHHFASQLLNIICSKYPISKDMVLDLWFLVKQLNIFTKIIQNKEQCPANFAELFILLDDKNCTQGFKFLVETTVTIESKVEEKPCYLACVYNHSKAKQIALKIYQDVLKDEIKRRNAEAVKNEQKSLLNYNTLSQSEIL